MLAGDAGHFKDPGPGRGIGDAFLQVQALAPAILAGLEGSDRELDRAMKRWGGWRDREFAEHYRFGADLSAAGRVPAVLPELVRHLRAAGRAAELFEVINHRRRPSQVLASWRLVRATGAAVARRRQPCGVLREVARLGVEDRKRRRLNRRPVYAPS